MLFTVTGLKDEEDDPIVEPDVPMRDDGCEGRFAKAYIHDEISWMDLRHEVRDLLFLAVPEMAVPEDDLSFQDEAMPDDGMEALWEVEAEESGASAVSIPEFPTAIAAPAAGAAMIAAPVAVHMIAMPEDVPEMEQASTEGTLAISAAAEMAMIDAPVVVPSLPEPVRIAEEVLEEITEEPAVMQDLPAEVPVEVPEIPEVEPVEEAVIDAPLVVEEMVEVTEIPAKESVGNITVAVPEAFEASVPVMEDMPAVRFSFGSQEVRGSGWRVCFSF